MRRFAIALLLLVAACHSSRNSVYNRSIPDRRDRVAPSQIADQLTPGDKIAWKAIETRINAGPIRSKTVGEAIERWNAQRACLQVHAEGQEAAGADVKTRDREIDAYNDCLEMDL